MHHKKSYRDFLAAELKGEKDIQKIWSVFLRYVARGEKGFEEELKKEVILSDVVDYFWNVEMQYDKSFKSIDIRREFYDFFGENITIRLIMKDNIPMLH